MTVEETMAAIGAVIDGKYEILKLVGKGGMSKVYVAMDKRLNKQWAVKEIEKKSRDKNNLVVIQSAIAEANMIKRLDHPTLPRIVDIIDNGNVIYIIMDYIEGESLSKVLEREGAQPQDQVIEWAKDLCEVLEYLHTREPAIIYRDMKPANVMLKPDGSLKLIDFGIAREYKDQNIEDTVSLGTKGYAAPEQFGGKGQTDARTDIYCLGVTLYHLVTGQNPCEPPYELYPIRHWNPSLSAGLEAIIQKCTQLNPVDRYQSCAELMYALEHYEEADESYKNQQKSKLKKFIISASVTLACIIIGCTFLLINSVDVSKQYKDYLYEASTATDFYAENNPDAHAKINKYISAINLKENELFDTEIKIDGKKETLKNPYFAIVESCCEGSDTEDVNTLNSSIRVVTENLLKNKAEMDKEKYGELSYKIAEYYLYYAPLIDSKKVEMAQSWIKSSIENENIYQNTAGLIDNITAFNRIATDKHSNDKEFKDAFDKLQKSISIAESGNDNMQKYDVYRLALFVIQQDNVIEYLREHGKSSEDIINIVRAEDIQKMTEEKQNDINNLKKILDKQVTKVYGGGNA